MSMTVEHKMMTLLQVIILKDPTFVMYVVDHYTTELQTWIYK